MNHGKHFRHYKTSNVPVSLKLKEHMSQPALEVGPMLCVHVGKHEAGFVAADGTDAERVYPYHRIEIITPHLLEAPL